MTSLTHGAIPTDIVRNDIKPLNYGHLALFAEFKLTVNYTSALALMKYMPRAQPPPLAHLIVCDDSKLKKYPSTSAHTTGSLKLTVKCAITADCGHTCPCISLIRLLSMSNITPINGLVCNDLKLVHSTVCSWRVKQVNSAERAQVQSDSKQRYWAS